MAERAPSDELLRSLGRLVRGLSALFWGLPLALILCTGTASAGWFTNLNLFGFLPSLIATGLVLFGLWEIGSFQRQERPWQTALDRARILALLNVGLCPFLYWQNAVPPNTFFTAIITVLVVSAVFLLFALNVVLARLSAMLPDEALRQETRHATALNRVLLLALLLAGAVYAVSFGGPPQHLGMLSFQIVIPALNLRVDGLWLVFITICVLVLLPLSMTMALIWKTKEVILDSVFQAK